MFLKCLFILLLVSAPVFSHQERETLEIPFRLDLEGALAWQQYNRNQIPNSSSGTRFDIAHFSKGALFSPRFYFSYQISPKHSLRAMVFPFQTQGTATFSEDINFDGKSFLAGQPIQAKYRFHSYRLSYRYEIFRDEDWEIKLGFTAKIRNAKIALTQNSINQEYSNVGFVPLLHFNTKYFLSPDWRFELDLDALAAPQGRAEDLSLAVWYSFDSIWETGLGYRTLEGGADNSKVYTFAWFHFVTWTLAVRF